MEKFEEYKSFIDRYFCKGYNINLPKSGTLQECCQSSNFNDVQILRHSNRICLVTLAPTHPIIKENKTIRSITFKVSEKLDRSLNTVSGKRKRGAQWVDLTSPLCKVTCEDDSQFVIYCGIRGNLVEMNNRLLEDPQLLTQYENGEGFIAIVMPRLHEADKMMDKLLDEENFKIYEKNHL